MSQTVITILAVSGSILSALAILVYCAINSADHDNEELWDHKHEKKNGH